MRNTLLPKSVTSDLKLQAEDNGKATLIVIWTLLVISGIFLGLRIYAKLWRGRHLWYDDHVLIMSWVS